MGWLPGRVAAGLVVVVGLVIVPAEAVVAGDAPAAQVAAPCPDPGSPITPADVEEGEALLVGTWLYCGDGWLLQPERDPGEVGLQIEADGRFFRVYEEGGALVSVEGLDQEGRWTFYETDPLRYQLDFAVLGRGTAITLPEFHDEPSMLVLEHMGYSATLVPWTGAPPTRGVPAGVGEGPCGLPTDPVELTSVEQVEELLVGTWASCGTGSVLGPARFREAGIEITADGRFFRLYDDGGGGLILADGDGEEGMVVVIDTTLMNGPGSYQVNFDVAGDGGSAGLALFLRQPAHFRHGQIPGRDYQPWAGAAPVPGDPPQAPAPEPEPVPSTPDPGVVDELPATGRSAIAIAIALAFVVGGAVLVRVSGRPSAR